MVGFLLIGFANAPVFSQIPRSDYEAVQRYFDGLRERGLFSLAETVCLRKLTEDVGMVDEVRYTVELSRTFSAHAEHVDSIDEQTELLNQARTSIVKLLNGRKTHPQRLLLEAQLQFVTAREIEMLRWRYELSALDSAPAQQALNRSLETIPALGRLDKDLTVALRNRSSDVMQERLTPWQLRGIQQVVRYRVGMVHLDRAKLLEPGSPDRAESLVEAKAWFRQLAGGLAGESITWKSQLALIETTRLTGDSKAALRMLTALQKDDPPPEIVDASIGEHAEILLADRNLTDAADLLREHRRERRGLTPQLYYLNVKVLLEMWMLALDRKDEELAEELFEQAEAFVHRAASESRGYWTVRARRLLSEAQGTAHYGPEAGPLIQAGQTLFATGKLEEAATKYKAAWESLRTSHQPELAGEIGFTLGSILFQQSRFEDAARIFSAVAAEKSTRTENASFLSAVSLGRLYQQQPTTTQRETFVAALEQHRSTFTGTNSAGDAAWMQAQLEERRLQTTVALRLYSEIRPEHPKHLSAMVAVARCAETILERLARIGRPRIEWESAVVAHLAPYIRPIATGTETLTGLQAELLLRMARIMINLATPDFATAERLLTRILDSKRAEPPKSTTKAHIPDESASQATAVGVPTETASAALGLQIASLAGLGRINEARISLEELARDADTDFAAIFRNLDTSAQGLNEETRQGLGRLQLRALELAQLDPATMTAEKKLSFHRTKAGAHEMAGDFAEAASELEQVVSGSPTDSRLRRRLAKLLQAAGGSEHLAAAKTHWTFIESKLKPGSPDWMKARIEVVRCAVELGEKAEAVKLLRITSLLYPAPENPETLAEFKKLAAALKPAESR